MLDFGSEIGESYSSETTYIINIMNLVQKQFSYVEYYEEQREYGFIQDVARSGLKRTMKRNIGRARTKVADVMDKSIKKDVTRGLDNLKVVLGGAPTIPSTERSLLRRAKTRDNTRVLGAGTENTNMTSDQFSRNLGRCMLTLDPRFYRKANNATKTAENIILHPNKSGTSLLAHEIGHIENRSSKNPITRKIAEIAAEPAVRMNEAASVNSIIGKYNPSLEKPNRIRGGSASSMEETLNDAIIYKIINKEESNASKRGLKLLKKNGASKDEIKAAKEFYKNALGTYKNFHKADIKNQLRNKIAIPSRRN